MPDTGSNTGEMMKFLSGLLLSVPLTACAHDQAMLLQYKDVQSFKVEETYSPNAALVLSGLAFHSALAVDTIEAGMTGDCLDVLVHLVPTRQGLSGGFTYTLPLPDKVNSVCFGPEQQVIWRRKQA